MAWPSGHRVEPFVRALTIECTLAYKPAMKTQDRLEVSLRQRLEGVLLPKNGGAYGPVGVSSWPWSRGMR
jgi:hypothetical protein